MSEAKNKSMLCVGGPHAGRRYDAKPGTGFVVPVLKESAALYPMRLDETTVEHVEYRSEIFRTNDGDVSFWVPAGQTPAADDHDASGNL
jgi:hypothetical protein